jgi:hypothetical protein
MTARDKKIHDALMECYTELYSSSTPSANFQELMDNATINERGQKEIPFMDYVIEEKTMSDIIAKVSKKYKFDRILTDRFRATVYLGCSPKTKRD